MKRFNVRFAIWLINKMLNCEPLLIGYFRNLFVRDYEENTVIQVDVVGNPTLFRMTIAENRMRNNMMGRQKDNDEIEVYL